mmetsp:Transcript_49981/g.95465  ORF Transcript_49981/g.95465 Transcript_49981/m.95465 type:complete len:262 (+) Transcript_49981:219-1004(+)
MQNLTQKFLGRGEPSNSDANVNAGLRNPGVGVSAAEDQAMPQSGTPGLVQQAVYLGNVSGIPLYVHYSFFMLCVLITLSHAPNFYSMGLVFMLYGPVLFCTILVHELGHCYATRNNGDPVHSILFWPLGGLALVGHSSTPFDDLKVSVAGPATHIPMVLLWLVLLAIGNNGNISDVSALVLYISDNFWVDLCRGAITLNIGLFLFNLLIPAYPLDGGRIFVATLLIWKVPVPTTALLCIGTGGAVATLLFIYGAYAPEPVV